MEAYGNEIHFAVANLTRLFAVLTGWTFVRVRCIARFQQTLPDRILRRTSARLVILILVSFGLAFSPGYVQASHCPDHFAAAELTRHTDLGAQDISGQDHGHEDGDRNEQERGHLHGHDPADHSHQLAFPAPAGVQPNERLGQGWLNHNQIALRLGPDSGLERPPKGVLSI